MLNKIFNISHIRLIIFCIALASINLAMLAFPATFFNIYLPESRDMILWVSLVVSVPIAWIGTFKVRLVAPVIAACMLLLIPSQFILTTYGFKDAVSGGMQIATFYLLLFRTAVLYMYLYVLINSFRIMFDRSHGWTQDSKVSGPEAAGLIEVSCVVLIEYFSWF